MVDPPYVCVGCGGEKPTKGKFQMVFGVHAYEVPTQYQISPPSDVGEPYPVPHGLYIPTALWVSFTAEALLITTEFVVNETTEYIPLFAPELAAKPLNSTGRPTIGLTAQLPEPSVTVA